MSTNGEDDLELRFLSDTNILMMLARRRGFTVKDVAHDGNCLFSAVEFELSEFTMITELRENSFVLS